MNIRTALRRFYGLDTKENRALPATVAGMAPSVGMVSPHFTDYRSYLQAFKLPWVHKSVMVIAENCANVAYELYKPNAGPNGTDANDDLVIDRSPFLDLLAQPNEQQSGHELLEQMWIDAELTGNAFWSLEAQNSAGQPAELYRLNPAHVIIRPDARTLVGGYRYSVNGKPIEYAADEVWQFKYPNPLDDLYGMGQIEAAEARIDSEMAMSEHERQFWRNGAKVTGVIQTDSEVDETIWARLQTNLRTFFRNSGYSTLLLEAGMKYAPVSDTPAKLDLLQLSEMSRDVILAIFGVPPTKVGVLDNANYKAQAADEYFWHETIDPKLTRLEYAIQPLIERFHPGEGLRLRFKRVNFEDDLPAANVAKVMSDQRAFTINEIRLYQGAEPLDEGGDVILVDANLVPFDPRGALATVNEIRQSQGDPPLPGGEEMIIVRGRAEAFNLATGAPVAPVAPDGTAQLPPAPPASLDVQPTVKSLATGFGAPASAAVLAKRRDALIAHAEQTLTPHVARYMSDQEARVTARVMAHKNKKAALAGDDPFDASDDDALATALTPVYHDAITRGYAAAQALGLAVRAAPDAAALAEQHRTILAGINETTRTAVSEQITEGLRRAYSVNQIVAGVPQEAYKGIAGVFADAKGYRAQMIARTEAMRAFTTALTEAYRASGRVRYCEMLDGVGDANCAAINGSVIPLDDVPAAMMAEHPNGVRCPVPLLSL